MPRQRKLDPKPLLDECALLEAFDSHGIKHSHAKSLWRHVVQLGVTRDFHKIPDFPKKAAEIIQNEFTLCTSRVIERKDASDGSTTKLLIELQDGNRIESVIMRYGEYDLRSYPEQEKLKKQRNQQGFDFENDENMGDNVSLGSSSTAQRRFKSNKRATLCVSSQVGCAMACKFCATGTMGLMANLSSGEILEQVYHASKVEKIRNVVFMGMGEPLDNYEAVAAAVRGMTDVSVFGLSPGKITVSTVGLPHKIHCMLYDMPNTCLALSLHAPDQETRLKIVPTAKNWDIHEILESADTFVEQQNDYYLPGGTKRDFRKTAPETQRGSNRSSNRRRKLLIEYALIGPDVNCTPKIAEKMGKLLSANENRLQNSLLNIIPYNPTSAGERFGYEPPSQDTINKFVEIVRSHGVNVMVRQELGQDVNAACGQLVVNSLNKKSSSAECDDHVPDIEDSVQTSSSSNKGSEIARRRRKGAQSVKSPIRRSNIKKRRSNFIPLLIFALSLIVIRFIVKAFVK